MSERKYSVSELDGLRRAIENKYLWGSYCGPSQNMNGRMSRSYNAVEKSAVVEEKVRTHMLAGHTAEDLYASEAPPAIAAAS